ncbi:MAG: hypothetical protein ACKORC_00120 [Acidimicrobiia bacterium]
MLVPGGSVVVVGVSSGAAPATVLLVVVGPWVVGVIVETEGGGSVSGVRPPGVLELVVELEVLEVLEESGPIGEVVLVVELVPEIVVVVPGTVVVVPPVVVVVVVPATVVDVELVVDGRVVVVVPAVVVVVDAVRIVVLVVELLVELVVDGRVVVVPRTVVVVPRTVVEVDDEDVVELLLVEAGRTVVEVDVAGRGQPPPGAGMMSSGWSPWPLRPLASTVIVT